MNDIKLSKITNECGLDFQLVKCTCLCLCDSCCYYDTATCLDVGDKIWLKTISNRHADQLSAFMVKGQIKKDRLNTKIVLSISKKVNCSLIYIIF